MKHSSGACALLLVLMLQSVALPSRAEDVARSTELPACALHVDAAAPAGGDGSPAKPLATIASAVETAAAGDVICVAEGEYREQLLPGTKPLTLAGGFQSGSGFTVRDSAAYVSRALGNGGSFLRIVDPGPTGDLLTAIDGFDISGYSQAILRDHWESQRFDITNNVIHDNVCENDTLVGAGFALNNISGTISRNVLRGNSCGRGGAGFLNDTTNQNTVVVESNTIEGNAGTEQSSAHGGALYLFGNTLQIRNNVFSNNRVTQWGGGLYVGAYTPGGQPTKATLSGNVYRNNQAGDGGGGFFCDDGATCIASHEVYVGNCGGNILLDGGSNGSGPTTSSFDHITNVFARSPDCSAPGAGVFLDTFEAVAADSHSFRNSIFWGNAPNADFVTACGSGCEQLKLSVTTSMVQTNYGDGSVRIDFGAGNVAPADPLFNGPEQGNFTLQPDSPAAGLGADLTKSAATTENNPVPPEPVEMVEAAPSPPTPALVRGEDYFGFVEKFNRFYTDAAWQPSRVLFVSPQGGGDGSTRETAKDPASAVAEVQPGTLIHFLPGDYRGGLELTKETGGTYDLPVVLLAEPGTRMNCDTGTRKTCINLEGADYVAVSGFEFVGGAYGVRAVGLGFDASQHSRGIAVIGNRGHGQERDPFFSGQSDWAVWDGNVGSHAGKGDGHGIYISNGSDWNIVRNNETHSNASSGFQINADPASTCAEENIPFDDPLCDAYGGDGEGGRGASDYFLIENNYFHHDDVGANLTSLRRSIIRNNVFGPSVRHNVSFWQETENPRLGSSDNTILHNLFVSTGRVAVQFQNHSLRNAFANNVLLGVTPSGGGAAANPDAVLLEVDPTAGQNLFAGNLYVAGQIVGRSLAEGEFFSADFSPGWFAAIPMAPGESVEGYRPTALSPLVDRGLLLVNAMTDRLGTSRASPADLGPFEAP